MQVRITQCEVKGHYVVNTGQRKHIPTCHLATEVFKRKKRSLSHIVQRLLAWMNYVAKGSVHRDIQFKILQYTSVTMR